MATADGGPYAWFDDGPRGGLLLRRLGHGNAAPHLAVIALVALVVARRVLLALVKELAFVRDSVAGLLARCGCFAFDAFFEGLIERQSYDFPDYYEALSTACLERHLQQKILKKSVLKKYQAELERRLESTAPAPRRARVRIQGLETYNFRANPTYVAKFALDSRIIREADAESYASESPRDGGAGAADEWRCSDADVDFAADLPASLPSAAAGAGADVERGEEEVGGGAVWVDEREPDAADLDLYAVDGGLHHGRVDRARSHLASPATRRESRMPWHERWAADDDEERRRTTFGQSSRRLVYARSEARGPRPRFFSLLPRGG